MARKKTTTDRPTDTSRSRSRTPARSTERTTLRRRPRRTTSSWQLIRVISMSLSPRSGRMTMATRRFLALGLLIFGLATSLFAQKGPLDELGLHPEKLYDFSNVDSV